MTASDVTWTDWQLDPAPELSDDDLERMQGQLGVRYPEDYLDVVSTRQGAAPEPSTVPLPDGSSTVFDSLLHFAPEPAATSLPALMAAAGEAPEIPPGVVPFAVDPASNLICFDFRADADAPTVVFWPYDTGGQPLQQIAESFTDLLDRLQP